MNYVTVGRKNTPGKIVSIFFNETENFKDINKVKDRLILSYVSQGAGILKLNNVNYFFTAPCILCLNEQEDKSVIESSKISAVSLYFHPSFINLHLTFEILHEPNFSDFAQEHNFMLLRPFLERNMDYHGVLSIDELWRGKIEQLFNDCGYELQNQSDFYWSCRSRSYFMELLIMLERIYGPDNKNFHKALMHDIFLPEPDELVQKALSYIHSNYQKHIKIEELARKICTNRTTLSNMFKKHTGYTIVNYINRYRIQVSIPMVSFTNLSINEISCRVGISNTTHFSKIFYNLMGMTPLQFRTMSREKRNQLDPKKYG